MLPNPLEMNQHFYTVDHTPSSLKHTILLDFIILLSPAYPHHSQVSTGRYTTSEQPSFKCLCFSAFYSNNFFFLILSGLNQSFTVTSVIIYTLMTPKLSKQIFYLSSRHISTCQLVISPYMAHRHPNTLSKYDTSSPVKPALLLIFPS